MGCGAVSPEATAVTADADADEEEEEDEDSVASSLRLDCAVAAAGTALFDKESG